MFTEMIISHKKVEAKNSVRWEKDKNKENCHTRGPRATDSPVFQEKRERLHPEILKTISYSPEIIGWCRVLQTFEIG